jgi:hypothetical protein
MIFGLLNGINQRNQELIVQKPLLQMLIAIVKPELSQPIPQFVLRKLPLLLLLHKAVLEPMVNKVLKLLKQALLRN